MNLLLKNIQRRAKVLRLDFYKILRLGNKVDQNFARIWKSSTFKLNENMEGYEVKLLFRGVL